MIRAHGRAIAIALCLGAAACVSAQPPEKAHAYADFMAATLADLRDDHAEAASRYYDALQRSPDDADLASRALAAALAANDVRRARAVAHVAIAHRLNVPQANLVLAVDALAAGHWRESRDQALRVRGGAVEELTQRIVLLWARAGERHVDDGIVQIADAGGSRPFAGLFGYQQAMALDYSGRSSEALQAYQAAALGGLWLPPAVERYADLLSRSNDQTRALAILQSADGRQNNPSVAAMVQRLQGGEPAGLPQLTPARGAAIGLYGFAAILLQQSEPDDGLALLTLALMLDPDLDAARISYAEAQVDLGHADAAQSVLAHIAPQSPFAETAKAMQAWVLLGAGQKDEAVALAEANAQGGGLRAQRTLADIYRSVERYADAEPIYTALIAQQPDEWRLYFSRGAARDRLGRWPDAEADLRRALALSPDQPEVLNYLGYTWIDQGENLQEGLTLVQRAAALRPQSGAIVDSLGWAYFKLGDYDRALSYLERAVELDPSEPTVNAHLGDAYWRVGRRLEARFQWQRALSLNADAGVRPELESRLTSGLPPAPASPRAATR